MVELLHRPRVFVAALWATSMLISGLLGGLLIGFESGTMRVWFLISLLGPALVWCLVLLRGDRLGSRDLRD